MGPLPSPSSYSKSPHVVFAMCISIWDPSSAARLQGDKGTEVAACRCTTSAARIPRQDSTAQGHVFGSTFLIVSDCVFGEACRRTTEPGAAAASNFSDEPRRVEEGLPSMTLNLGKYAPQSCETFDTLLKQKQRWDYVWGLPNRI
jgi:hypothetical protein